ncbi:MULTISPECIES: TetR/AcrR family transcriptional regulator [Sphingomonadales]|nr:TetR family transcriptional regulator [Rhizorhabdus wittichii DC-6]
MRKTRSDEAPPAAIPPRPDSDSIHFDYLEMLDFEIPTKGLQQRSIDSRNRIIGVASKAFMGKGYAGVSTHEISAEAGVTQGLITYHFKSKDGLWQAAMDQVFGEFRNSLAERIRALRGEDEPTVVAEIIRHLIRLALQYPAMIRFMVESGPHPDQHLLWLLDRHIRPIYLSITHVFEVGKAHGILRDLPVSNAYYVLLSSSAIFSLEEEMRIVTGDDVRSDVFFETHAACMLTMLMNHPPG